MGDLISTAGSTIFHSSAQMAFGVLVGTTADMIFPAPEMIVCLKSFIITGIEVAAQLAVNALATAVTISFIREMEPILAEASGGISLALALIMSQSNLRKKIEYMSMFIQNREVMAYVNIKFGTAKPVVSHATGQAQQSQVSHPALDGAAQKAAIQNIKGYIHSGK